MFSMPEYQRRVLSDMSQKELARLVASGESDQLEFKRRVPKPARIAKEVIALANTHGGRLLLGVNDNGTITGLRDAEEEEFALRRALSQLCDPPIEFETELILVEDARFVIVVRVPESEIKPHYLRENGSAIAYVRVRDKSIEASPEAMQLMQEEAPNGVLIEFGEKEQLLMRYLERYGQITVQEYAKLADLSEEASTDILVKLTRASVLIFHRGEREDFFTPSR